MKRKAKVILIVSLVVILIGAGITTFFIYKSNKEKEQVANLQYEKEMEEIYDDTEYEFGRVKDHLNQFEVAVNKMDSLSDNLKFSIYGKTFNQHVDILGYENRRVDLEDRVNKIKSPSNEMLKVDIALKKYFETYKDIQMNFTDFNNYDYKVYKAKMDNLENEYHQANIELIELRTKVIERRIYGK